ncbi:MAG: hypothetical protein KDE47_21855 [Caldilineaceae bacterium]|nr:hypothetical protein [Caldilineaceae bacterium]MCB0098117.1 hypothetical protein [Caldilineaceae bacterium]MCB9156718.1 hypothetical protein [Caldilineaceae bacterium]
MKDRMNSQLGAGRADAAWEQTVARRAATLAYPPTPDIAAEVARRLEQPSARHRHFALRPAWAGLLALLAILAGLLLAPPIRAAIMTFLQIGAVRIELSEPTVASQPTLSTPVPKPTTTPQFLESWLDLSGEVSLAEARAQLGIPLRLPTYPGGLGEPDRVYVQKVGGSGSFVLFIWLESAQRQQPRLTLMQMEPNAFVTKGEPEEIVETMVHGQRALWTTGPYGLVYKSRGIQFVRLIDGHVLIWTEQVGEQEITFRLESGLSMAEAVRVAESLAQVEE